jgi:hypothetical protein
MDRSSRQQFALRRPGEQLGPTDQFGIRQQPSAATGATAHDFGDSWTHGVVVEDFSFVSRTLKFGVCLNGEGACPPEDVGGIGGYQQFLEALADPLHEGHDDMLGWVGFRFDPDAFSVASVNAALERLR